MISVVLPMHNPDAHRLSATLAGLSQQTLPRSDWEFVVIDNCSTPPLDPGSEPLLRELGARVVVERELGLTPARLRGFAETSGDIVVLVDDDNVLDPDYLAAVARRFAASPALGAAGGPVIPRWDVPPPAWTTEFHGLLALRDRGGSAEIARGGAQAPWPSCAPVGAGMAVRRSFARAYLTVAKSDPRRRTLDRAGASLSSGGDNDLVFTILHAGGDIAYFPELKLFHLIPAGRLEAGYLARLNRGIMRTWVRVLTLHGHCPWKPIAPVTLAPRVARAWWRTRAWRGPAEQIRWAGARGQFEGLADVHLWPRPATA